MDQVHFLAHLFIKPIEEIEAWNACRSKVDKIEFFNLVNSLYMYQQKRRGPRAASPHPVRDDLADDASSASRSVASRVSSWMRSKSERHIPSSSASTNSSFTSFSQLTATTSNSSLKFPKTVYADHYEFHRRGFAINARNWNPPSAFDTNFTPPATHRTFSSRSDAELVSAPRLPAKVDVDYRLFRSIFRVDQIELVAEVLLESDDAQRIKFLRVIRGLSSMSRLNHFDTWNVRQQKLDEMYLK